jgi:hypothetical protein
MPKKLVVHAAFRYTDTAGQRRRAFRGETINISKKEADRGDALGVFGTAADLVPVALDEGVVDLSAESPTTTPVVPLVSKASILEGALRERLGVEPGASEADVLAALDQALDQAQTATGPDDEAEAGSGGTLPPAPTGDDVMVVHLPPPAAEDEPAEEETTEADEGPPPLSATKERWVTYAVKRGMPAGEASAKSKADLITLYGGG